jgi:S1-C subfamily serine protease
MKTPILSTLVLAVCVTLATGCGPTQAEQDATATQAAAAEVARLTAQVTATATPTRTPRPTATPTSTPTSTPTPAPLTAAEVFERLSPSVVFVDTPAGTGSGVLIEGGYLVTNAHVVWPYMEVRVVFPDGAEHLAVKLLNSDLLGDLAVLGPVETDVEPITLADGEDLVIGSEVFLIGYPGEVEEFPQPTITGGHISRLRESTALGLTYFQTDAPVAGGQSGGILVSDLGQVIGISGFSFTEVSFGLVASAADLLPRLDALLAGEDVAQLGDRHIALEGGQSEHEFRLSGFWDERMYVLGETSGAEWELAVESDNDAVLDVLDVYGQSVLAADEGYSGVEAGTVRTDLTTPYFVRVSQATEDSGDFRLRSNRPLIPYDDQDDGRRIKVDQTLRANIDYPGDLDYFVVDLTAGEAVYLLVESAMIDPYVVVDYEGAGEAQVISVDDTGQGIFGLDAELTYRAPHDGRFYVAVYDATGGANGGYTLSLAQPDEAAPTPWAPLPTPVPIDSPVGPMALYESQRYPFAIEHPFEWTDFGAQPELGTVANYGNDTYNLSISEEDLGAAGNGPASLAEFTDLMITTLRSWTAADFALISRRPLQTAGGLATEVIEYTLYGGAFRAATQLYLHDGRIAFSATFGAAAADYPALKPVADYAFSTFRVAD